MASEKERMLSGQLYNAYDSYLVAERKQARSLLHRLNITDYGNQVEYSKIISELLPNCPSDILIEPPFFCDYGCNIYAGNSVFLTLIVLSWMSAQFESVLMSCSDPVFIFILQRTQKIS